MAAQARAALCLVGITSGDGWFGEAWRRGDAASVALGVLGFLPVTAFSAAIAWLGWTWLRTTPVVIDTGRRTIRLSVCEQDRPLLEFACLLLEPIGSGCHWSLPEPSGWRSASPMPAESGS